MAWLALGNALGRRCGRSDCALCRPTLGGEIGRDLAKILLRKAFGDGRHDRVVAFAIPVVTHLLEEIAPLLPPYDRDGFSGIGLVSPHQPESRCPRPSVVHGINRDPSKAEPSSQQTTFIWMENH